MATADLRKSDILLGQMVCIYFCERYLKPIPMQTVLVDSEDFEDARSYGSSTDPVATSVVG